MKFVPEAMRRDLPLNQLNPENLVEDMAAILDRRSEWSHCGLASRRFVERWHDPKLIAQAMLKAYESADGSFELTPNAE
ncbi:glycosyltransferase [Bradyrhizobium sp. AZCC 2230]|uniref:glycosyltransferase n=1 Tax=Bradyrhizobium sp. AZCC 2230 TaxID=3117021 RepID=UPI002FEEE725